MINRPRMNQKTGWKEKLPRKPRTSEGWIRLARRLYGRDLNPEEIRQFRKYYYPI